MGGRRTPQAGVAHPSTGVGQDRVGRVFIGACGVAHPSTGAWQDTAKPQHPWTGALHRATAKCSRALVAQKVLTYLLDFLQFCPTQKEIAQVGLVELSGEFGFLSDILKPDGREQITGDFFLRRKVSE
jgi:hypothetical protein